MGEPALAGRHTRRDSSEGHGRGHGMHSGRRLRGARSCHNNNLKRFILRSYVRYIAYQKQWINDFVFC